MPTRFGAYPRLSGSEDLSETPAPVRTPPPFRPVVPEALPPGVRAAGVRRRFLLGNDPQLVAPLVALLGDDLVSVGVCDRHTAGRVGIALEEAILNAIYHGNLEISSELKANGDEPFRAKVRERQVLAPYRGRAVRLVSRAAPGRATFVVADMGPGFDVANLPDPTDPENLVKPSGRGLLLMRAFMDEVRYNPAGNCVTMVKLASRE
jgi:anti-sigma regulatory factor (Ser/Thr protein kinase)